MVLDAWLPVGYKLPDGQKTRIAVFEGLNWQVFDTQENGRALVVHDELANRWIIAGLISPDLLSMFDYGNQRLYAISCGSNQLLSPLVGGGSPNTKEEALSFVMAFNATREIDTEIPLQDALYIEKINRLLPVYSNSPAIHDDVVLGLWLTGGVSISIKSFRKFRQAMGWMDAAHLKDVIHAAGFEIAEVIQANAAKTFPAQIDLISAERLEHTLDQTDKQSRTTVFELAGRPELAAFFNEHIVDIVMNRDRYKALGIEFPSAVILHGPPGTGKTYAVEQLIDFLGWPSFHIDSSSVASPYIHETSKKVAEVFEQAMESAPSVLVIDEMEAFLADREMGSGHHRVEEVAEFLRRIPEAVKNEVLIIAMTNRIDMIDSAIQRRGRFDHVIKVDFASEIEVLSLLDMLLSSLPTDQNVDSKPLARELAGRPLSDVAFVVREGARLAARSGKEHLGQENLLAALRATPAREREGKAQRRIGFMWEQGSGE